MHKVWLREWQRFCVTPRLWILTLLAPLLLSLLILWIFSRQIPLSLPLLLLDYDQSSASRELGRQLQALPAAELVSVQPDMHQAAAALRQGGGYALVVVPPSFERDLMRGDVPQVALFYNSQMMTAGNVLLRDVRTVVATLGAGISMGQGQMPAILAETRPAFNPGMDYARFLAIPLMIALFHIAMVLVAVDVTGRELREHTAADWLASSGGQPLSALLGKLLPYSLWFTVFGLCMLGATLRWLGIVFQGQVLLWALGWLMLVLACFGLGALLVLLTANLRMAISLASVVVSPAFAYAGLTFPSAYMPSVAKFWSLVLPLSHGLSAHMGQAVIGASAAVTVIHLLALLPFVVLPLLFTRRWQRLMSDPECWGKS